MERKINLLMLVNYIPHYRIPIYEKLGDIYNLTVAHYDDKPVKENIHYRQIKLKSKKIFKFKFFKENIFKLSKSYDVVLTLSELWTVPNMLLGFRKRKFGLVHWGIGVTASYDKKFDSGGFVDKVRMYISGKADSILFYSDYPIKKYVNFGIKREKLFTANNTVLVKEKVEIPKIKKHFIFVGSLYTQKKIYDLLEAYKKFKTQAIDVYPLIIIGDGDEKENIEKWINEEDLENFVFLKGQINDQLILQNYYQDSIACISPGQAGLTVLNSMAYGVPFITSENAITGGEILNLNHNVNGILYDGSISKLTDILLHLSHDDVFVNELSENAQKHYFENRTIENMVKGFEDSINFAFHNTNKDF